VTERIVAEGVEAHLGEHLKCVRSMGGGCIGEVYRAELEDGTPLVAKIDRDGESHLEREAYMLRYLREKSDLPVPEVLHGSETLLLMEFIEGSSRFSNEAEHHAAELLAALHGITMDAYGHRQPEPAESTDGLLGGVLQEKSVAIPGERRAWGGTSAGERSTPGRAVVRETR
jgi:fructosamine-3-kinase